MQFYIANAACGSVGHEVAVYALTVGCHIILAVTDYGHIVSCAAQFTADFKAVPLVGNAGADGNAVIFGTNAQNILGYRYIHPGRSSRKPADICKPEFIRLRPENV